MRKLSGALLLGVLALFLLGIPYGGPRWPSETGGDGIGSSASRVRALAAGTQQLITGTDSDISFAGSESYDVTGWHNPAANPERFVVPRAGLVVAVAFIQGTTPGNNTHCDCRLQYDANADDAGWVDVGGFELVRLGIATPEISSGGAAVFQAAAGSWIKLRCQYANSGAQIFTINAESYMSITRIGPTA